MAPKTRKDRRAFGTLLTERAENPFDPMVRVRLAGFLERHGHRAEALEEYRLAGRFF